tara:strand:- start:684 stop:809 length:126 start_codon:yes stop_codon:yes gene_type:complete
MTEIIIIAISITALFIIAGATLQTTIVFRQARKFEELSKRE